MSEAVFFYLFTIPMLLAAASVIISRQPIYSVLSLLVVMLCLASLFVMLHAYLVAALQVLLYAGAVLVLFLFVLMLLNLERESLSRMRAFTLCTAGTIVALAFLLNVVRIFWASHPGSVFPATAAEGTVESIGRLLFSQYVLPFELTSFLILAAIIGAVTLARQEPKR
ncbi:MAG: NADH-quinone oxidoreductase subunit J [Candidatus Omnitrophica bacterium]|nr:NADH-quinone oxidoreductase subunit J [Candidatus Omnitrophota bacterium]